MPLKSRSGGVRRGVGYAVGGRPEIGQMVVFRMERHLRDGAVGRLVDVRFDARGFAREGEVAVLGVGRYRFPYENLEVAE